MNLHVLTVLVTLVQCTSALGQSAPLAAAINSGTDFRSGPIISQWTHRGGGIAYLFAGNVTLDASASPPHTEIAVGAQLNAVGAANTHQILFGTATEAWALPGSLSQLTGLEASTINMEPANAWQKVGLWTTYKTRPDASYADAPLDAGNMNSQALRVESQPGTGFERGIVLGRHSLHASRLEKRPILLDLRELDEVDAESWDLVRFPDGCALRYAGHGQLRTVCEEAKAR